MANIVEILIRGNDQSAKAIASSVKNLQGMDSAIGAISRHLSGILSVGALVALGKSAIEMGSNLSDASKKFGVSASELSALQYVAKLSGVGFEDLGGAFKFLSKAIAEAENPSSDAAIAFKAMGISVKDANGNLKPTNTLFMEIADAFAGMKDGANKTALSLAIFGRAGANILPVFADGAAGINKLKGEAKTLGATLSEEEIKKLDDYGDTIDKIGMAAKATAGKIIVNLVSAVDALADSFGRALGGDQSGVAQGKIADILVPNPDPGKKKEAPNIEAMKKAAKDREKLLADYEKLHAANLAKEGEAVHETLAAEMGWTQEYYDTISKMSMQDFEEWKKQQGEEANLLEKFELDKISMLKNLQDAQRAETEGEGPAAPYLFDDAMRAAEAYGNVSLAIQTMNSNLGAQYAMVAEGQTYIDLYKQAWLDANLAVAESIASLYSGMQGWISSSLQGLITGTMDVMDVVKNLGKMMLSIITDYVAKWIVSRLFMAAMGKTFQAAEVASAIAAGTAVAAAWASAAAMTSLASFGSNAAAAMTGIGATLAFAKTAAIAGAAHGGLDYVPAETTYLLDRGERVVSPKQNEDLTDFLSGKGKGDGAVQDLTVNLYMDSEVICNVVKQGVRAGRLNLVLA